MSKSREELEQLVAGGPSLPPEQTGAIGVPPGYVASVPAPSRSVGRAVGDTEFVPPGEPTTVAPRYFQGDEWQPATASAEDIARLQQRMVAAGLIPKNTRVQIGAWDEVSRAAYSELLGYANATGTDWQEALRRYAQAKEQFGGPKRQPLTVEVSNPATLRKIVDRGSREVLGRKLSAEEQAALVSAYQAQERAYQETAYATAEEGGTVVEPPDPLAFAEEEVRRLNPGEAGAADVADTGNEFFSLLREVQGYGG